MRAQEAERAVRGKVVLKETGRGIADLLVVVFDIDPVTSSPNSRGPLVEDASAERVGSVLTDAKGEFVLSYDPKDIGRSEDSSGRPDLVLGVFAPDDPEGDPSSRLLYLDRSIRRNAGRLEHYIVRISEARLTGQAFCCLGRRPKRFRNPSGLSRRS
jgi:hypothetical protein